VRDCGGLFFSAGSHCHVAGGGTTLLVVRFFLGNLPILYCITPCKDEIEPLKSNVERTEREGEAPIMLRK